MTMTRARAGAIAGGALAAVVLTGCSGVSTGPDQVALHYEGGSLTAKTFKECVPASKRQWDGPGDSHFVYPQSQRTYDATGAKGAESDPFTVVSKDNAEMRVPVTVTLTLKGECETLRAFHERLGNRYSAYFQDEDKIPEGWVNLLNFVVGKPLDTSLDRVAQQFNWRDLWNNPTVKAQMEREVGEQLGALVDRQAGGQFLDIGTVLIQKPDPVNTKLKENVADEQASVAKANSAKAEAAAQRESAEAQIAVQRAEAAKIKQRVDVIGVDGWLKEQAIAKGISPWPAPILYPGASAK